VDTTPIKLPVVSDDPADLRALRAARPGLPRRSLRAARALAQALFETGEAPLPTERLDWVEAELGDFFAHVSLRARLLFRTCVATISWVAPLLVAELPPLSRLTPAARVEALHRLERTPFSLALFAAKAVLCIVYYEHPDAAREIGWDQRCLRPGDER
jgi:hypothetical protein